jgi:hypothetical protein
MLTEPVVVAPAATFGAAGAPGPEVKLEYFSKTDPGPPAGMKQSLVLFKVPIVTLNISSSEV